MIHSSRVMPSGNFGDPVVPTSSGPPSETPFRFPAEYYCAPLSEVKPIFPRWVPFGCGSASAVILVLMFVAGALFSGPRFGELMDFVIGTSIGELRGMYARDVTAAEKQRFDSEVERMREALRNGRIPVKNLQPFMKEMQSAIFDKSVTAEEVERLTKAAHDAQGTGKRRPATP